MEERKKVLAKLLEELKSGSILGILDCRHKEIMVIRRRGGDVAIEFYSTVLGVKNYEAWFQMKRNDKVIWEKILNLFREFSELVK